MVVGCDRGKGGRKKRVGKGGPAKAEKPKRGTHNGRGGDGSKVAIE